MEKEIMKHSIFKQDIKAKRYRIVQDGGMYSYSNGYYKKSIVTGFSSEVFETREIFNSNIEMPLLEIGDKFYIEELSKIVHIKDRIRTSKENVLYQIEDEIVEDGESADSLAKCEEMLLDHKDKSTLEEKICDMNIKISKMQDKINNIKKTWWFKLFGGKFKTE